MTDSSIPPIDYVCPMCGNRDHVVFDTISYWDVDAQCFAWVGQYSHDPMCGDCGYEGEMTVVSIETSENPPSTP